MSGARWICFCGSDRIKTMQTIKRDQNGHWLIYAKCIKCRSILQINKYGIRRFKSETSRYLANR
jgi:hypothetical protein